MIDHFLIVVTPVAMALASLRALLDANWQALIWVVIAALYFTCWRIAVADRHRYCRAFRALATAYADERQRDER